MYEAKILKHSISSADVELITFEVNYPHAVHKDIMTHRWARNFQSFRAVPPEILLGKIAENPFIPEVFGHRVKGMGQRNEPIEGQDAIDQDVAREIWLTHVQDCIIKAERFLEMGIAKQQVNFLLQDLCFIRGIITTTLPQLDNFYGLRLAKDNEGHPVARPEVYKIAAMMQEVHQASTPQKMSDGEWHLPLVRTEELGNLWLVNWEYWRKVSVGRCARVSYLTHNGERDPSADVDLHDRLMYNGHMSPFEHQGTPIPEPWFDALNVGSFGYGWVQYRKLIPGESNYKQLQQLNAPHLD